MSAIAKYDGPSARRISGTALAVRTLSGQTKLLVPVSAAAATAKKHSHHKQILVVPTPGGGARLATVANSSSNSTLLRHTHLHPHHTYSSSTGPTGSVKRDSSYTYNRDNYKSNSASSSRYIGNHDNGNNGAIDTAQLIREQQLQQQQLKEQYFQLKKEEEMIPEWKRKEDFFAALGLVTKQALKEIQNKKCERKRRTTANPQFSNAAIEAKRINAMEVAAKRAKRKELAAAERHSGSNSAPLTRIARRNSQMPIVPHQTSSLRSSMRPSTSNSSQPAGASSSSSSSSFHHKAIFRQYPSSPSTNMTVAPDRSRNLVERLKSRFQLHTAPYPIHHSSSSSHNSNTSSRSVNLKKAIITKTLHNCYSCCETCDPDLDAIMFCKPCQCYFHATCVASVDEINKTNSVPCPGCDKETTITFDGFNQISVFDLDSTSEKNNKSEVEKPTVQDIDMDTEDIEEEDVNMVEPDDNNPRPSTTNAKVITLDELQRKMSSNKKQRIIVMSKADFLRDAQSLPKLSIQTRESLITRKSEMLRFIDEGKKRYSELNNTLSNLNEDKIRLLQERNKIQDCLKKVTNVIRLVKSDASSQNDVPETSAIPSPQESSENNNTNETTNAPPTSEKTGECTSSSSDDDSISYSESDEDEENQSNVERLTEEGSVQPQPEESIIESRDILVPGSEDTILKAPIIPDDEDESLKSLKRQIDEELTSALVVNTCDVTDVPMTSNENLSDSTNVVVEEEQPVQVDQVCEIAQEGAENLVGSEEAVVLDDVTLSELALGGDEVLISTEEDEGNLVIIGNEPVTLEKSEQFDDETSAAVASIQDQLDTDDL